MKIVLESVHLYEKVPKTGEKILEVTAGLRKSHDLAVRHLLKVNKIVENLVMPHTSINAEFNVYFKTTKLS
jgi:hypothetical protein